ncbi:MAG: hypothetical protein LBJ67_02635 [Planctomycetaceae bacterium]|jgi:hypothetical protein|nr:hypothetical protein [Planctomycetaceae bacterium]
MKFGSLIVLLFCLFCIGCDHGTKISGTVKFSDGTPVTKGQVVFDNGTNSYFGAISSNGSYITGGNKTVEGIPNGNYKIWFAGTETTDNKTGADGTITSYTVTQTVAKKYTSPNTTDLKFEVKSSGATTFDITVEKP